MQRAFFLLGWGLCTAALGGCGSCGQGSHEARDEDAAAPLSRTITIRGDKDGGRTTRLRPIGVIQIDGGTPP